MYCRTTGASAVRLLTSTRTIGAIPGTYTTTVHRSNGRTTSGTFTVGAPNASGNCVATN